MVQSAQDYYNAFGTTTTFMKTVASEHAMVTEYANIFDFVNTIMIFTNSFSVGMEMLVMLLNIHGLIIVILI